MTRPLTIEALAGDQIAPALPDVARLRIEVFRAFPYLYDGSLKYEEDYLTTFARAPGAVIVVARDGDAVVGASTGAPLAEVEADWSGPFLARGIDIRKTFYCAESVLLSEHRGQGIGHAFFDHRERHARSLGAESSCFCSVIRAEDHPLRPAKFRSNDAFWRKRRYAPMQGITAQFAWTDIGDTVETQKTLQFWSRNL